eukprot:255672-Pelagomonas_calceolata.AAC.1
MPHVSASTRAVWPYGERAMTHLLCERAARSCSSTMMTGDLRTTAAGAGSGVRWIVRGMMGAGQMQGTQGRSCSSTV